MSTTPHTGNGSSIASVPSTTKQSAASVAPSAAPKSPASASVVHKAAATTVNEEFVTATVTDIGVILSRTAHAATTEVGEYLLDRFYGGDVKFYRSTDPTKHASLKEVARRCDTHGTSRSFLANALRIAAVGRELPAGATFHRLPVSHRVELARVRDADTVEKLAAKAIDDDLTVRDLRTKVDKATAKQPSKRSGARFITIAKHAEAALRKGTKANGGGVTKADIDAFDEEQSAELERLLKSLAAGIKEVLALLK